jgi:hypothetical protein
MARWARVLALIIGGAANAQAADEGPIRGGTETFKLNLGTIFSRQDTTVRVDGPNSRGVEFGLENVGGVQRDRSTLLASGSWRFAPNHRVGFQTFSMRRHAEKNIEETLVIKDQTIPVGTNLSTSAKTDFLIANYQYSLLRDDRVELSAMGGVYAASFRYQFDATSPVADIAAKTTAPLPMFGVSLDTFVTPRWTVSTFFEGFYLKIGDVKGGIAYYGVSTDYMLTRHLGLGLGISATTIGADITQSSFSGAFRWQTHSAFAYGQVRF